MTKTIMILAIVAAFVAGMLVSAPQVFAPGQGQGDTLVSGAIDQLTAAVEGIPAIAGPQGEQGIQGEQGDPGGIIGFYKVRVQETVTEAEAMNGALREGNCDANDFPISVGWFASVGSTIDGMSLSEMAGGSAGVFVRNLAEGSAYGVGVNCADFEPAHVP